MSQPDADARVLEQFLKTMAPPAALTAVYRQRVVHASLEARTKILVRRQRQMTLAICLCLSLLMVLPGVALTISARSFFTGDFGEWFADVTTPPPRVAPRVAVDSYETSAMEAQWLSRLQHLLLPRQPTPP